MEAVLNNSDNITNHFMGSNRLNFVISTRPEVAFHLNRNAQVDRASPKTMPISSPKAQFSSARYSLSRRRQLLQDCFVQTNAALEIFERKILVRRMGAAVGKRESYEQRLDAENFTELGDDRYAAALAY